MTLIAPPVLLSHNNNQLSIDNRLPRLYTHIRRVKMIIDHTDAIETLLAKHLVPHADQHNFMAPPEPSQIIWYDYPAPGVAEIFDQSGLPIGNFAARTHEEVQGVIESMGKVAVHIGHEVHEVERRVHQWIAVQTDAATIAMLEGHRETYVAWQGSLWWGRTSNQLMTDPVYIWLVDRQIQTVNGAVVRNV
jgi:hypothetical protein